MKVIFRSNYINCFLYYLKRRSNEPEHDIVNNRAPCMTPSHVWMPSDDLTGIVPSPDSIFVRSWPRALRFGCRSTVVTSFPVGTMAGFPGSCGEKIRASPHGAVLMYKWKRTSSWRWKWKYNLNWFLETVFRKI